MKLKKGTPQEKWLVEMVTEKDKQLEEMEDRLEGQFDRVRKAEADLEAGQEAWKNERYELKAKIQKLEEELKYERRRASQALDVAAGTSDAARGIGRLLHVIVDNEVLEELRLSAHDRRQEAKERLRHRRPSGANASG